MNIRLMCKKTPPARITRDLPTKRGEVSQLRAWLALVACSTAIATIWTVALPSVAELTPIKQHIETMQRENIVVDAMFYTELNWDPSKR